MIRPYLILAICLLLPARVAAQSVLTGQAVEAGAGSPLSAVEVRLHNARGQVQAQAVSNAAGPFRLAGLRPGVYRIVATVLGYETVRSELFELPANDSMDALLQFTPEALELDSLEAVGRREERHLEPALTGFYARAERKSGGRFILPEDIDRRGVRLASDLLITAGLQVYGLSPGHGDRGVFVKRTGCAPTVYLDGVPITGVGTVDPKDAFDAVNIIGPLEIEGIEVYSGAASVPAQFSGSNSGCGVVAIWSRR